MARGRTATSLRWCGGCRARRGRRGARRCPSEGGGAASARASAATLGGPRVRAWEDDDEEDVEDEREGRDDHHAPWHVPLRHHADHANAASCAAVGLAGVVFVGARKPSAVW